MRLADFKTPRELMALIKKHRDAGQVHPYDVDRVGTTEYRLNAMKSFPLDYEKRDRDGRLLYARRAAKSDEVPDVWVGYYDRAYIVTQKFVGYKPA